MLFLAVYQKVHYNPVYIAFLHLLYTKGIQSFQLISSCCRGHIVCRLGCLRKTSQEAWECDTKYFKHRWGENPPIRFYNAAQILRRGVEEIRLAVACLAGVLFQNRAKGTKLQASASPSFFVLPQPTSLRFLFLQTRSFVTCLLDLPAWKMERKRVLSRLG